MTEATSAPIALNTNVTVDLTRLNALASKLGCSPEETLKRVLESGFQTLENAPPRPPGAPPQTPPPLTTHEHGSSGMGWG